MNSDLLFQQHKQNEDISEEFADYTSEELQANLGKLIQTNVVYSYCESLIIEDLDYDFNMAEVISYYCPQKQSFSQPQLPSELLFKLQTIKHEIEADNWSRQDMITLILNLIIENTLLHSTLAKFVDRK